MTMKYCSDCGSENMVWEVPADDNRPRDVCKQCDTVFYQNPKVVAGCVVEWEDKILLCKRAIAPRHGYWTLPAGFLENAETALEGAVRETLEEANARVDVIELYALFNLPGVNQIYMMYRGKLLDLDFSPGEESLECKLCEEADIPWDELAFPTITETLKFYFEDRKKGDFKFHSGDIVRDGNKADFYDRRPL